MTILLEIPKVMNQKIRKAFDLIKDHFNNYPQLNANNKIDPSLIDVDSNNRFVTDTEKSTWNNKNINIMSGGKVDSSYLPSYVDDVLEYSNLAGFPVIGETGKIYIAQDVNLSYRWTGSAYTLVGGDPSLYQLKSEKNIAGGYLGLDTKGKIDSLQRLSNANRFGYSIDFVLYSLIVTAYTFNASTYTGAGAFAFNGGSSTPKLKSGSDTQLQLPILTLNANLAGFVAAGVSHYPVNLKSPHKLYSEQVITALKNTNKSFKITVSCGVGNVNSNTGSFPVTANLLVFVFDPTVNNGNWQVGKVVNGFPTLISTNVTLPNENIQSLAVVYDRATEIAKFYIDYVLVHEMTNVNLASTATFSNLMAMSTNDATETYTRRVSPVRQVFEIDVS